MSGSVHLGLGLARGVLLLLAGDLPPEATTALRAHLATCAPCTARFSDVKAGFDAPLAAPPFAIPLRRRSRRWVPALVAVGACAAALVLYVRTASEQPADTTRVKGGVRFTLYIKHGAQIRAAGPAETVAPGDQLQLTYTARENGHLAMMRRDGAGVASVYFPDGGTDAWPAASGSKVSLPRSTILDDVPGLDVVWVLHCPRPFALEPIRLALAASSVAFVPPRDCTAERFTLDKQVTR